MGASSLGAPPSAAPPQPSDGCVGAAGDGHAFLAREGAIIRIDCPSAKSDVADQTTLYTIECTTAGGAQYSFSTSFDDLAAFHKTLKIGRGAGHSRDFSPKFPAKKGTAVKALSKQKRAEKRRQELVAWGAGLVSLASEDVMVHRCCTEFFTKAAYKHSMTEQQQIEAAVRASLGDAAVRASLGL
jgi:hypothetical protein